MAALLLGCRLLLGHTGGLRSSLSGSGSDLGSLGLGVGALNGRRGVDDWEDAGLGVGRGRTCAIVLEVKHHPRFDEGDRALRCRLASKPCEIGLVVLFIDVEYIALLHFL